MASSALPDNLASIMPGTVYIGVGLPSDRNAAVVLDKAPIDGILCQHPTHLRWVAATKQSRP